MGNDYFNKILNIINKYENLGKKVLTNGTLLIGHKPQIAPEAYLHKLFCSLNENEINTLEESINMKIPNEYRIFLSMTNGLKLFGDTLSLDGLRKNYKRTGDDIWQPYSLDIINQKERIRDSKNHFFYIGGYSYDGSLLYIDSSTNKVYRCSRYSSKPLNEWNSFEDMIVMEVERIDKLFDEEGNKKDPNSITTP